jgi:alkylation response protein AidB-like acyl-CoA dehydrogenase
MVMLLPDEPGAGSDANSGKTKAVLSEDGKHIPITGQKNVDFECRIL